MQPKIDGYYIMGRYTSVAWYPATAKTEAERMATVLNYRGGQTYRVEPDYRREANVKVKQT